MLPNTKEKEDSLDFLCGGSIFIDHGSSKIDIYHQVSLDTSDTIRRKELYEKSAAESGVEIKHYRGENGVYRSAAFKQDVKKRDQSMDLSGVDVHGKK